LAEGHARIFLAGSIFERPIQNLLHLRRADLLLYPDGYATLDVGNCAEARRHFSEIDVRLRKAA
jgi:hypothetical protein